MSKANRNRAEILSIGTELLMGEIVDTNAVFLASELKSLGIELQRVTQVGDVKKSLCQTLRQALKRAELVITSGGLGPTADDLTRDCVAEVMGEEQVIAPELEKWLRDYFSRMRREMPETNLRQAMVIPSAQPLRNESGTAPGWWVEKNEKVIVTLPGPPRELKAMWHKEAKPRLLAKFRCQPLVTTTLKLYGLGEAKAGEMAAPFFNLENPTLGIYVKPDGIHLRLFACGENAAGLIRETRQKLEAIFMSNIWGSDDDTLPSVVGRMLLDKNVTLAVLEDGTRGLVANMLAAAANGDKYFRGGIIAPSIESKTASGISPDIIRQHGAISEETALSMASRARELFAADIGLSTTGITGVDGPEADLPAVLFIGLVDANGTATWKQSNFPYREEVRSRAAIATLFRLRQRLLGIK